MPLLQTGFKPKEVLLFSGIKKVLLTTFANVYNIVKKTSCTNKSARLFDIFSCRNWEKDFKEEGNISFWVNGKTYSRTSSFFNNQFSSIYEICQAYHRDLFKRLPLEIDCLIKKVFVSASHSLDATATNNEQKCLLFHEVKELGIISRTCKVGE